MIKMVNEGGDQDSGVRGCETQLSCKHIKNISTQGAIITEN